MLSVFVARSAPAQEVELSVDRRVLSMDEDLQVEVRATGAFDELVQPETPGFEVGGTSRSSEISMGPSGTVQSHVLRLTLVPTSPGRHRLGPASVRSGGREVARSEPVFVTVKDVPQVTVSPEQAGELESRAGERYFLVPVFPERPLYVGEPFVLSYKLYTRADSPVTNASWREVPELAAFSVENLLRSQRRRSQRRTIGRYTYNVSLQLQYLAVPLSAESGRVEGAVLDVVAGDFFQRRRYTVRAPSFELDIRPLPAEGRPPEFQSGNIGRFELETDLHPTTVGAGERAVLTLRVTGRGALESVRPPRLPEALGAELLPTGDGDRIERSAAGVEGTRVFRYVLVPHEPGKLTIPPIRLAYFDPERARYRVVTSAPMDLEVTGEAPPTRAAALTAEVDEESFLLGLRDIRAESDLTSRRPPVRPHRAWWFWTLLAVPAALLLAVEFVVWLKRYKARTEPRRRMRRAAAVFRRALKAARRKLRAGDSRAFFEIIGTALREFCYNRFGLSVRGLTHGQLRRRLVELGADPEFAEAVVAELENTDFARYAPVNMRDDEMRGSLERSWRLVASLNRLPRRADGDE